MKYSQKLVAALEAQYRAASDVVVMSQEALFSRLDAIVRQIIRRMVTPRLPNGAAEDVAQETLLRCWCAVDMLIVLDDQDLRARVRLFVHRSAIDLKRREQHATRFRLNVPWSSRETLRVFPAEAWLEVSRLSKSAEDPTGPVDRATPATTVLLRELSHSITDGLTNLTPRERDSLVLLEVDGESLAAIATRHGVDEHTTRRDVVTAKRKLRQSAPCELDSIAY